MIGDRTVNVFYDDIMLGHDPQVDLPFMPSRVEKRVRTVLQQLNFKWSYPEHPGRLSAIRDFLDANPVPGVQFKSGDSAARFIGWHAITILRVALDPQEVMRVYFYNPNNDSGQDWGDGVVVSTAGCGERFGEASLPFEQFASRLYIFHFDPLEKGELAQVSQQQLDEVSGHLQRSWGADRLPEVGLQASRDSNGPT